MPNAVTLIDPGTSGSMVEQDSQRVPSAIMRCDLANLLTPSVTFAENLVNGFCRT